MRDKITVMILPVGLRCNLACKYCYHGSMSRSLSDQKMMDDSILEKVIHDGQMLAPHVDFLWHGGEPLLAGSNHFKKAAIEIEKIDVSKKIRRVVQTNATLLDKSWCDLFSDNKFILSTSIDGDYKSHNTNRVFSDGRGSYDVVLNAISIWRKTGNPIGAIALVTLGNVSKAEEVYLGLKASGITSCAFHFCSQDEENLVCSVPAQTDTVKFFKKIFDLWIEDDDPNFPIRNFRNVLRVLCGGKPLDCTSHIDGCFGFMAITVDGDVYPCHRFVGRKQFCIGNIVDRPLAQIYEDASLIYNKLCGLGSKCSSCEWIGVCGNGCAYERFIANGSFKSTSPECYLKKEIFGYIRDKTKDFF